MTNVRLSQITPAPGPPALTDTIVGVLGGTTDAQVSLNQLHSSLPDVFINAATEFNVSTTGDQTANINNALSAASISSGRGTVVLPTGLLQISGVLNIPAGIRLIGQGMVATILQSTAPIAAICLITGSETEICDLSMTVSSGNTVTNGVLINGLNVIDCKLDRLNIDPSIGGGMFTNGVQMSGPAPAATFLTAEDGTTLLETETGADNYVTES